MLCPFWRLCWVTSRQLPTQQGGTPMANGTRQATRKRGRRGLGSLYKRTPDGKEHRPNSVVHGKFWLRYTVSGPGGKKRVKTPLKHPDGEAITDLRTAEAERLRIMAPYTTSAEVEKLKAVEARLRDTTQQHEEAVRAATPLPLLAQAWDAYNKSQKRPRSGPDTHKNYERHLTHFLEWLRSEYPKVDDIGAITPEMTAGYASSVDPDTGRERCSANTFNKRITFLKLFGRVMVEEGKLVSNPFAGIQRIPNVQALTNSRRELAVEQVYKLLSTPADEDVSLLFGLGYFTGLRRGDCCTLRWDEVDLVRRLITRVPNKTRSRKNKPVKVGIPAHLYEALSRTPPKQRRGYVLPRLAEFYNDPGKRHRITRMVTAHFRACEIEMRREGTGKYTDPETGDEVDTGKRAVVDFGFHSLRYSYISHHAERGTPQGVIQENAGHANPSMTQHYTRISDQKAREWAEVLTLPAPEDESTAGSPESAREPLPQWARELVETLTPENCADVKADLLAVTCAEGVPA